MRKKILFSLVVLCGVVLVSELLALGAHLLLSGHGFSAEEVRTRIDAVLEEAHVARPEGEQAPLAVNVPHPYLGFVYNAGDARVTNSLITRYGLFAEMDPLLASQDSKRAIVALNGGSVAEQLFTRSRHVLRKYLSRLPQFKDRQVTFIVLGRGAYQQPQQVLSATYYLMQGGRVDMMINIDGFNEVHHPFKNRRYNVYPAFPFYWHSFFIDGQLKVPQLAELALWKQARIMAARTFRPLHFSATASLFWTALDTYAYQQVVALSEGLAGDEKNKKPPYFVTGPDVMNNASLKEMREFKLGFWTRGSLQLHYLSQSHGFSYFHFLQPNQYDEGSKPLSEEERKLAFNPKNDSAISVRQDYAALKEQIPALKAKGVNIYDLTGVFKDRPETLYADVCCHLNQRGNDLLAEAIGQAVLGHYKLKP